MIVAVDGHRVTTTDAARTLLRRHRPGETVSLGVRNGSGLRTVRIKTIADPQDALFVLQRTVLCHGFYGASSMERLPAERAIREQTASFKKLAFKPR